MRGKGKECLHDLYLRQSCQLTKFIDGVALVVRKEQDLGPPHVLSRWLPLLGLRIPPAHGHSTAEILQSPHSRQEPYGPYQCNLCAPKRGTALTLWPSCCSNGHPQVGF